MSTTDHRPAFAHNTAGMPTYARGKRWPAWAAIAMPFILLTLWLIRHVRDLCWGAVITVIGLFEVANIFIEHHAVLRGHWVYNKARILGPTVWGVPIEEPLIYYLFAPLFVILIMHIVYQGLNRQIQETPVAGRTEP